MRRTLPFLVLAGLVVFGCNNNSSTPTTTNQPSGGATTSQPEPKKEFTRADIPASLKTDAYDYYGLNREEPLDMRVEQSAPNQVLTGSQILTLEDVQSDKAIFSIDRTGGLSVIGTQKISVEPDGIYIIEGTNLKLDQKQLELPANLTPGKSWQTRLQVDRPDAKMDVTTTAKVVGPEKVKTRAGERDALLITSTGEGTLEGKRIKIESKTWFVKGVGGVKAVIVRTTDDGKKVTTTLEEDK